MDKQSLRKELRAIRERIEHLERELADYPADDRKRHDAILARMKQGKGVTVVPKRRAAEHLRRL